MPGPSLKSEIHHSCTPPEVRAKNWKLKNVVKIVKKLKYDNFYSLGFTHKPPTQFPGC